jgi:hypothetical protein
MPSCWEWKITSTICSLSRLRTALLRAGPVPERREFLVQCVEQVLIKRHAVVAIRPVSQIAPLLVAANARLSEDRWRQMCVEWAGWGSNPRPSV